MPERYKILIADDEQELVTTLRDFLEYQGFETLYAYEGVRAVELAHKKNPDLILLDLQMPAGTGQKVLESLRSRPETEKIPVIVITAIAKDRLEEEVQEKGAQDFIQKPFDTQELLSKIYALLS
jgi:DNA-binding response OmpR family regulator